MQLTFIIAATLPLLAAATPIHRRAGAPSITPIPSNCTIMNPLPHASDSWETSTSISGYMPSANFSTTHLLYSAYFESSLNATATATQCLEQCYGYGDPGQCKSAFIGYKVPTPKGYYGTAGGVLGTACLMYDAYLDPNSFVAAPSGQYVDETAGSIYCPS